jgi:hypothetical protein
MYRWHLPIDRQRDSIDRWRLIDVPMAPDRSIVSAIRSIEGN